MTQELTRKMWRKGSQRYREKNKNTGKIPKYATSMDRRRWEKNYRDRKRSQIIEKLGGKCARCGFDNPLALCIDHVNGGGVAERTSISQKTFLNKVLGNTTGMYQLLCANCNLIKRFEQDEFWRKHPCGT